MDNSCNEIGGYFGLENLSSNHFEYHQNAIYLNSARNCLLYIIKARDIQKIYLPFYLCDSLKNACIDNGIDYDEYDVDDHFLPIFKKTLKNNECLLVVNYYGQIDDDTIIKLKSTHERLIIDNSQCFFAKPIKGVDTFYSCRKFFGVPDGGILISDIKLNEQLEIDDSSTRCKHLLGRINDGAEKHYLEYRNNEATIKELPIRLMSHLTFNMLMHIDYSTIKTKREQNYSFLAKELDSVNQKKFVFPTAPFCYPLFIEEGQKLREYLISKKIYIPILWPYSINKSGNASVFSRNILPIPCDQRYGLVEMKIICDRIKEYLLK